MRRTEMTTAQEKFVLLTKVKGRTRTRKSLKNWVKKCDCWPRCSLLLELIKWTAAWCALVYRVVGFFLFAVWANDCFFREFRTTATCRNFTLFPNPQMLTATWLLATTSTSVSLLLYIRRLPEFPRFKPIARHLVKQVYFYKVSVVLLLVVVYDFMTLTHKPDFLRALQYSTFLMEHVTCVMLVVTLNFVPKFLQNTDQQYKIKNILYKLTLAMYSLEGYGMYLLGTIIAIYKVLTISSCNGKDYTRGHNSTADLGASTLYLHESEADECHDAITVVMLLLLMNCNALRHTVGNFFMAKLFSEEYDILGGRHEMIVALKLHREDIVEV